jgi:hypothetical protein
MPGDTSIWLVRCSSIWVNRRLHQRGQSISKSGISKSRSLLYSSSSWKWLLTAASCSVGDRRTLLLHETLTWGLDWLCRLTQKDIKAEAHFEFSNRLWRVLWVRYRGTAPSIYLSSVVDYGMLLWYPPVSSGTTILWQVIIKTTAIPVIAVGDISTIPSTGI